MWSAARINEILSFLPKDHSFRAKLEEEAQISTAIAEYAEKKRAELKAKNPKAKVTDSCGTSPCRVWEVPSGIGSTYWFEGYGTKASFFIDDFDYPDNKLVITEH
jgi:hypothetical protein